MEILKYINNFYYPRCMAMKMWENFFKKINKPVPVFAQTTKMEKENSTAAVTVHKNSGTLPPG